MSRFLATELQQCVYMYLLVCIGAKGLATIELKRVWVLGDSNMSA